MARFRVIWDNGTPDCLPGWAREELVYSRLALSSLRELRRASSFSRALTQYADLVGELAKAQGASESEAVLRAMETSSRLMRQNLEQHG